MTVRLPFRFIEPAFFAGLLDDPILQLYIRPLGRSLLMDCGRIHHLAKRVLKSVSALFISHAHMDHFMGIDTFVRSVHVSPRTFDIYGPPGLAAKLACKLSGYDWNLAEPYWCSFRVHEVFPDHIATTLFAGPENFTGCPDGIETRNDRIIYRNRFLHVEADSCDHKIATLIFRVSELPSFQVDPAKIEREGLVRGEWLRSLKKQYCTGTMSKGHLVVPVRQGTRLTARTIDDAAALYERIRGERQTASAGYVTDIGFSKDNLETVTGLLRGVTLLVCECSFLASDKDKARVSAHLCTSDVNVLVDRIRPTFFLPVHLSKSYIHSWENLYDELELPPGVSLLRLPKYLTPRPLLPCEARSFLT